MPNEIDSFFNDLPGEDKQLADIFAPEKKEEEPAPQTEEAKEEEATESEASEPRKNPSHDNLPTFTAIYNDIPIVVFAFNLVVVC